LFDALLRQQHITHVDLSLTPFASARVAAMPPALAA